MHILTEIFRDPGVEIHGKTDHRSAVRAVVIRMKNLLMVYSPVNGDYKFPGGGVDENENLEVALKREVAEECGMKLISILGNLGCIIEYAIPVKKEFDVFKMTSSYYLCEVDATITTQRLDRYEAELGFQPVWVDIDTAIQNNKAILRTETKKPPQWTAREVFMLEYIRKNLPKFSTAGSPLPAPRTPDR
jgi:8-oxo-dGTP pyrophosphatase MutT (NUDIX family)